MTEGLTTEPAGKASLSIVATGEPARRRQLTVAEREAKGRAARTRVPRSSHGQWRPAPDRPDPVTLLEDQSAGWVADLVPVRYGRMLASPFAFHRGAALIMAEDLADTPRSDLKVQLCGDAHLANFGVFGTPERRMIFDIRDFDETIPGPWEWDVKRLAASFEIMGRDRGFRAADRRAVVLAAVRAYRQRIRRAAMMRTLHAWYDELDITEVLDMIRKDQQGGRATRIPQRRGERGAQVAQTRDSVRVLAKRTAEVNGEPRIVAESPLIVPLEQLSEPGSGWEQSDELIDDLIGTYRQSLSSEHHPIEEFRYVHAARKVVGVGGVGTRCFILLMLGRDRDDPLLLQLREAQPAALERFLGSGGYQNHGQRVVAGQRLMQGTNDIFLGWLSGRGRDGEVADFYVRQFQAWKGGVDIEHLLVPGATIYAQVCGATLAHAHARWGDRIAIGSYLGSRDNFDKAIVDFAIAYADQNERDYQAFAAAVKSGRLVAET